MTDSRFLSVARAPRSHGLLGALLLASLGVGCASEFDVEPEGAAAPLAETSKASAANFVQVTANGTGCPAGTWEVVDRGHDGSVLRFQSFIARVDRRTGVSVKDCQLSLKVATPDDVSFGISGVRVRGDASLDKGVSALVKTQAYFQGAPDKSWSADDELEGPQRKAFQLSRASFAPLWSPCGKQRDLQVRTTVRLKREDGRQRGFFDIDEIELYGLRIEKCGEPKPEDGGTTEPKPEDGGTTEPKPEDGGTEPKPDGNPGEPIDPAAPGIAQVSANGTGCPRDTSRAAIAADRLSADLAFDAYEATVDGSSALSVKDCTILVGLRNTDKYQYRVNAVASGYAFLDAKQDARVVLRSYVQGDPSRAEEAETSLKGPKDAAFRFTERPGRGAEVWTPCGAARDLVVSTTTRLTNGDPRKDGYVSYVASEDEPKLGYRLEVESRRCD